jgi:hypothetical protein
LIRNLPYDLRAICSAMESVEGDLAAVARDHAQFVRTLASRRALLKREYYIIVPAEHEKTSDPTEALITANSNSNCAWRNSSSSSNAWGSQAGS